MSNRRKNQNSADVANLHNRQPAKNGAIDESIATKGIYNNPRIIHTTANMVGCNVNVVLKNGEIYEGIFSTLSPELDICMEYAKRLDAPIKNPDLNCITLVFSYRDIVCVEALNIDMNYAISADGFTDSAISKASSQNIGQERELQPWQGDVDDDSIENSVSIDDLVTSKKNGWDANEMFKTNSKKFNVKSDYNPDMPQYTTVLEKSDTPEFRARALSAERHARSIEQNDGGFTKHSSARDNGYHHHHTDTPGDEESKYSAVIRPHGDSTKYVPPQKRKTNGQSNRSSDSPSRSNENVSTSNVNRDRDVPSATASIHTTQDQDNSNAPNKNYNPSYAIGDATLSSDNTNTTPSTSSNNADTTNCSPLKRDAKIKELKNFKNNFKLSETQEKSDPVSTSTTQSSQAHMSSSVSSTTADKLSPSTPPPPQAPTTQSSTAATTTSSAAVAGNNKTPLAGTSSNPASNPLDNSSSSSSHPQTSMVTTSTTSTANTAAATTTTTVTTTTTASSTISKNDSSDTMSVSSSTIDNRKSLNINAKVFVPEFTVSAKPTGSNSGMLNSASTTSLNSGTSVPVAQSPSVSATPPNPQSMATHHQHQHHHHQQQQQQQHQQQQSHHQMPPPILQSQQQQPQQQQPPHHHQQQILTQPMQRMNSSPHQMHQMNQRNQRPLMAYYGRGVDSTNNAYIQMPNNQAMNISQVRPSAIQNRVMVSAASATGQPLMAASGPNGKANGPPPPPPPQVNQQQGPPPQQPPSSNQQQQQQQPPPQQQQQVPNLNNLPSNVNQMSQPMSQQQPPHTGPSPVIQDSQLPMPLTGNFQLLPQQLTQYFHSHAATASQATNNPMLPMPPPNANMPMPYYPQQPNSYAVMPRLIPMLNNGQPMMMPDMYMAGQQQQQQQGVPPTPNNGQNMQSQTPSGNNNNNQMNNAQMTYQHQMANNAVPPPTSPQGMFNSQYSVPNIGANGFIIANHQANILPQITQQMNMMQMPAYTQALPPPQLSGVTPPNMPPPLNVLLHQHQQQQQQQQPSLPPQQQQQQT